MFHVYDVVRVVRLIQANRACVRTEGVRRLPQVGDIATVVHAYDPTEAGAPFAVECVATAGSTLWLADFSCDELALVMRCE